MDKYLASFLCVLYFQIQVFALEKELTINVDPGKDDCFYQDLKKGDVIDVEYQVIDGGHGDLDITFHLVDPTGRILVADYKKSGNNHRADASLDGAYKICFDNTFSSFNVKTVFFELIVENESDEWDNEKYEFEGINPEDVLNLKIENVNDSINVVRRNLEKIRHSQLQFKRLELIDRSIMEDLFTLVNAYSFLQLVVMLIVGGIQVVMIKSLFDDSSRVHKLWQKLNKQDRFY